MLITAEWITSFQATEKSEQNIVFVFFLPCLLPGLLSPKQFSHVMFHRTRGLFLLTLRFFNIMMKKIVLGNWCRRQGDLRGRFIYW